VLDRTFGRQGMTIFCVGPLIKLQGEKINKIKQKGEKGFNVNKQLNSTTTEMKAMENKSKMRGKARNKISFKPQSYYKPASHPPSLVY
jgi:hypothetical protein